MSDLPPNVDLADIEEALLDSSWNTGVPSLDARNDLAESSPRQAVETDPDAQTSLALVPGAGTTK